MPRVEARDIYSDHTVRGSQQFRGIHVAKHNVALEIGHRTHHAGL